MFPPVPVAAVKRCAGDLADGGCAREHLRDKCAGVRHRKGDGLGHRERLQEELAGRGKLVVDADCGVEVLHNRRGAVQVRLLLEP